MKNFETAHRAPTANNLSVIQSALEYAGVEFISKDCRGPGVLDRVLRLRGYRPDEGLFLEVFCRDWDLVGPDKDCDGQDNDFDIPLIINDAALVGIAGRCITSESDAKAVVLAHKGRLIGILKNYLIRNGLSSPGGKPRVITSEVIDAYS